MNYSWLIPSKSNDRSGDCFYFTNNLVDLFLIDTIDFIAVQIDKQYKRLYPNTWWDVV